jgi:pimeloyl-ACP methyl ester carboxylesterase
MMTATPIHGQLGVTALIYVVVIALFVWRMMRPSRVSVARIWTRPALLVLFTALAIWGQQQTAPAPAWQVAAMLIAGAIIGIPLGILRGRHSIVKPTGTRGVFVVQSSPLIVLVWLAAFIARAAIRYVVPGASHGTTIWSIALLAFATAAIAASAFIVHGKLTTAQQSVSAT